MTARAPPVVGARALPDGEIAAGTPIPALVPLPTIAMAPAPGAQVSIVNGQPQISGAGNPGFPFFVPGVAGHRPPHTPLDTVDDGGLPRHVIVGGVAVHHEEKLDKFDLTRARFDFDKEVEGAVGPRPAAAQVFLNQPLYPVHVSIGFLNQPLNLARSVLRPTGPAGHQTRRLIDVKKNV